MNQELGSGLEQLFKDNILVYTGGIIKQGSYLKRGINLRLVSLITKSITKTTKTIFGI
ncbi:hypothetical protein [Bacillus toyonensis]|uniref:hypothetical protein n=1 Tax=Bacillus toyonensis TaxID=155322 RepID=UPI0015D50A68|nr:hypothetical protein [Bacillus toyonensis]